jgi:hypothetical protein
VSLYSNYTEIITECDINSANISLVVDFQRWWVLKSKTVGQESIYSKDFFFNLSMNVSLSKIGHDFSNKVVQKLPEEKNVFDKKWSPKLIFFNDFFLNSVDF